MSQSPPGPAEQVLEDPSETYCYGHPKTPTRLRCSRCDRPICGRCAIPASVGQHCPDCIAEARRGARKVRSVARATSPATLAIVVISIAFYVAQQFVPDLTARLGAYPPAIADGQWWRLLTPMLLHAPNMVLHIAFNMYVLWIYGPQVEQAFGTRRFLFTYVATGFLGGATSYALGPCQVLGVGASGAIFGLVGALLIYLYNRRRSAMVAGFLRGILIFVGFNLAIGFVIPGIDNLAHLGGLASGVLLGAGFDGGPQNGRLGALQVVAAVGVVGLGVALVLWRSASFACGPLG